MADGLLLKLTGCNMLKFGIISELDAPKGLARVLFPDADNIVSNWLPVSVPLTLNDKISVPLFVNEHVWCVMDDNLEYGVIGGAIYSTEDTPASGNANKVSIQFAQGLLVEYNRSNKTLSVSGSGKVKIDVNNDVEIKSATKVTLIATTEVDITAPLTKVTGAMNVIGTLTAGAIAASGAGGSGGSGNVSVDGNLNVTGNVTGGQVKEGLIRLGTHKHTGVATGGGTSGTPTP